MSGIRIGVIGAGRIGRMHAAHLAQRIAGAELAGITDVIASQAQAVAQALGVVAYPDHQAMLADPRVDAVAICSSTDTHATLITAAAAAGKPIFCEKPIALDLATIDTALAAVARAGVVLQIGFQRRFDPGFAAARQSIVAGQIGRPELLRITSRDPQPPPLSYLATSGGLFLDMMIHDFDMARFLMGDEVVSVSACAANLIDPAIGAIGDIDSAIVTLQFASGAIGAIDNSRRAVYGYDQRAEVLGSAGALLVANPQQHGASRLAADGSHAAGLPYFFIERYTEAYLAELRQFVACLGGGAAPAVSGADGRAPVVMALAAARSWRERRPVALHEVDQP